MERPKRLWSEDALLGRVTEVPENVHHSSFRRFPSSSTRSDGPRAELIQNLFSAPNRLPVTDDDMSQHEKKRFLMAYYRIKSKTWLDFVAEDMGVSQEKAKDIYDTIDPVMFLPGTALPFPLMWLHAGPPPPPPTPTDTHVAESSLHGGFWHFVTPLTPMTMPEFPSHPTGKRPQAPPENKPQSLPSATTKRVRMDERGEEKRGWWAVIG